MKNIVWRFLLIAATLPCAVTSEVDAQDSTQNASVQFDHARLRHHLEAGFNALGAGLEYRYQWFSFLSTDGMVTLDAPGAAFGVTFSPLWIFYVQALVGTGGYKQESQIADGPPAFKPSYVYGWDAGFHFPVNSKKTRLYFIFAFGQLRFVQNHYNYNGGGFIVGPPPTPLYRRETRPADVFSIGLGLSF